MTSDGSGHFIVLALPRSRTAWLTHFLCHGSFKVGHDIAIECKRVDDFVSAFDRLDGAVETGAVIAWRLIRHFLPKAKLVVIRRSVGDVVASFERLLDMKASEELIAEMESRAAMLDEVSRLPGVMTVSFSALNHEPVCASLFRHCLGIRHDHAWWASLSKINIQIDMSARLALLAENHDNLRLLKAEVLEMQCAMSL